MSHSRTSSVTSEGSKLVGETSCRTIVATNQPCILCVDDDLAGLAIRGELLRGLGYVAVLIGHPELVLSHDLSRYQLAILDFDMPGMNGYELANLLRRNGATFPIVLLSGDVANLTDQQKHVFSGCIHKGSSVPTMISVLTSLTPPHTYDRTRFAGLVNR